MSKRQGSPARPSAVGAQGKRGVFLQPCHRSDIWGFIFLILSILEEALVLLVLGIMVSQPLCHSGNPMVILS
jgi:hypothetical protein